MFSLEERRDEVQKIIDNTRGWLSSHGHGSKSPWPQHEIDIKQRRLDVMKVVRDDYAAAIDRKRGAA
ncbi:hypothetical protein [Shinella sp. JR1-6]|uniref:hypothetical protein n=1 Tax=Shinella sp. JR1-6 TaxID=2527671 RepID=UPI00102D4282|nr:hypothetical protein [Shinella sp. JR1-6]TAA49160.1 hypothetical protein EXZ48_34530 [Shinella sp. JR1-6]